MHPQHIKAWQCIGCGKIEAPQNCVGICQDRRVELVLASQSDAALADMQKQIDTLTAVVRQLAHVTPRCGEWESSYRALQALSRQTLQAIANTAA